MRHIAAPQARPENEDSTMKVSVSNIAWDHHETDEVLDLVRDLGVSGIEIAPSKIWPGWEGASVQQARSFANRLEDYGLSVPALQAILFGKPDLQVFGDADQQARLLDHIEFVAALAAGFGASVLVFGSPNNRDPGPLSPAEAVEHGATFFKKAGDRCKAHNVVLGLEPNPRRYHCRFLTSWRDVIGMTEKVAHECVQIHLDTACIEIEGDRTVDAISLCAGRIAHFHVTEPELGDFSDPTIAHDDIANSLKSSGYARWTSIEMRRQEPVLSTIRTATEYVMSRYA